MRGNRTQLATIHNNLGLEYWRLGIFGRARRHLERYIELCEEVDARAALTYSLESYGRILLDLGELDLA